ncbi:MAG: hypothetical protein SYR96_17630 [Actinomycetota bacterium]|nr:hypothetical protein [Actinomycetota bacterium]
MVLAEGDIVPADATVTEAAALLVDESALTGESVPVGYAAIRLDRIVHPGEQLNGRRAGRSCRPRTPDVR